MYMLEKLITNLKKSLLAPFAKKQEAAEDEAPEESSSAPSPDEDKKKKQISMIIRVAIILILGYLVVDEFVLKKNASEPSVDELLAAAPKKKKKPQPTETTNAQPTEAAASSESVATPSEPPAETTANSELPPIENVNVMSKDDSSVNTSGAQSPASEEIVESKPVETGVDQKLDQLVNNFETSTETPATGQVEEVKIPSMGMNTEVEKKESAMTSKIVDDGAVETAPPAYDQLGRGLVYNCKDKYWACLDKPAYVVCNKNMKWNQSKGNPSECVVQAIYGSDEDCAKIQKYNVSSNVPTAFCQN